MIYLGLGVVVLILVLGFSRAFVAADPAKLAHRFGKFVGAVQRRRADFHLLGILSLQWEDEKGREEK